MSSLLRFVILGVVLALLVCTFVVDAHVIGVDFGSEFIKVAGPHGTKNVDVVLNELSKRKTENYIGFRNSERYIGEQAKILAARFPLLTCAAVNQLMGMQKSSEEAAAFSDMQYEYKVEFDTRNTVTVPIKDSHGPFTAEELYATMLSYTQQIAKLDGVISPEAAVVTIPFHASIAERRAVLEAGRLAGLDILGFLHSTTAAALYYGMRHRGFGDKNLTIVVFDVGTTHTEAAVYRFAPPAVRSGGRLSDALGTLTTVAVIEDKTLGGRALDLCVAKMIEDDAVAKLGIPRVMGGRTLAELKSRFSLMRAANKVREVLSANTNTPLVVEGIAPDRDFHSSMTRDTFEASCAPLLERVRKLTIDILRTADLAPSQVDAFEMMGGAARTPRIIADVSAAIGRDVDRTLNMDEAATIGAAYYAVKLSPFYYVKSFNVEEQVPFDISFTVSPPPHALKEKRAPIARDLLTTSDLIGKSVSVSLNRTDDFALSFFDGAGVTQPFAQMALVGVKDALDKLALVHPSVAHPNNTHFIRIQLKVNETGLLYPEQAELILRYVANTTKKVGVNETGEDGTVRLVSKTEHVLRMRKASKGIPFTLTWMNPRERTGEEWLVSQTKLYDITETERAKRENAEAKNSLEGFMFWVKGDGVFYNDELVATIEPAKLAKLREATDVLELWLEEGHGSTDACTRKEYEAEHTKLKAMVLDATGAHPEGGDGEASSPDVQVPGTSDELAEELEEIKKDNDASASTDDGRDGEAAVDAEDLEDL